MLGRHSGDASLVILEGALDETVFGDTRLVLRYNSGAFIKQADLQAICTGLPQWSARGRGRGPNGLHATMYSKAPPASPGRLS